jgi:hypothetical protein
VASLVNMVLKLWVHFNVGRVCFVFVTEELLTSQGLCSMQLIIQPYISD